MMEQIEAEVTLLDYAADEEPIPARMTRLVPFIPIELARQIACHLDLQSALRLARTCRSLRLVGELRIWSVLDLLGSRGETSQPIGYSLGGGVYRERAAIVDLKVDHVLVILQKQPHFLEYIEAVRLEPSDGGPTNHRSQTLIRVLALVAPHIRRLEILPLPTKDFWSWDQQDLYGSSHFFDALNETNLHFPHLVHLKYAYPGLSMQPIDRWLLKMGRLQELELCSANGTLVVPPADAEAALDVGVFPNLRRITFDHVGDDDPGEDGVSVLGRLLRHTPNLRFFRLRGEWRPTSSKDETLQMLGSLSQLRTVVVLHQRQWDDGEDDDDDEDGYVALIESHRFGMVTFGAEEMVKDVLQWEELSELQLGGLHLPRAPALRKITLLTTARAPLHEYASLSLGNTSARTDHIHLKFLHQLQRTPLLTSILLLHLGNPFPSAYDPNFVEPEYFVEPSRWEREGHRGIVIREYESPAGRDGRRAFWHIRYLSRTMDNTKRAAYVGMRRTWQDGTQYRGRTVPRSVMEAVYESAGEEKRFVEGGRGMRLGQGNQAWDILDEWRDRMGDESDVEDDFEIDGTEDDDLESEDE